MNNWRFVLSKQWAGYLALTIIFAIVCCLLGVWQLNRRTEAQAELAKLDANYASEPVPLADVIPGLDSFDESDKWTPIVAKGVYLVDEQVLVRNRPYGGRPGFEVLTPLQLADGSVFIVDRGWVEPGSDSQVPKDVPAPPAGVVTVVARLKAGEPTLANRGAPEGQIATIHLPDLARRIDQPMHTGAYGLLATETPAVAVAPFTAAKPIRDEGPHLSYALQWFVFAIFGFVGLGYGLRQEYRAVNVDDPLEKERAEEREARRAAKQKSDADIEDELLDA